MTWQWRRAGGVAALTAAAAWLRLASLSQSFFGDELYTYEGSAGVDLHAVLRSVDVIEKSPPLYFVVAWASQKLGDPFVWLRMPSLFAGVAAVPLIYALGRRTLPEAAARLGAALFALSPLAVFYATEARAYSLMTMLVLLATLSMLRYIDSLEGRWLFALALSSAAAMYCHYSAVFVLGAQAGWALYNHRAIARSLLLANLAAALWYVPWLPSLMRDGGVRAARIPFTVRSTLEAYGKLADGLPNVPIETLPGRLPLALLGLAAVVGLLGGLRWVARAGVRALPDRAALIGVLAVATPVGMLLTSFSGQHLFVPRNLIASLPASALGLAALLTALPQAWRRVTVTMALVALSAGAVGTLRDDTGRPPYAQAAAFINDSARTGDVVVELQVFPRIPPGRALEVHLDPSIPWYPFRDEQEALAAAGGSGRVFYVSTDVRSLEGIRPEQVEVTRDAVERRTWDGLYDVQLVVYAPPRGARP